MDLAIPSHAGRLGDDLQLAAEAALAAALVVLRGARNLASTTFEAKGAGDLVSEIDREADRAAMAVLEPTQIPVLSEELQPDMPDADDLWIVDPLDGSGAYLMQVGPQYPAVLVARRHRGRTTAAVCLFPLTGEWFYAVRGQGAFRSPNHGQGEQRLDVGAPRRLKDVWVETNRYGDAQLETPEFAALQGQLRGADGAALVTANAAYSGVAARIASAATPLSVCIHDNAEASVKQAPWDIAAPQLIIEEAGGVCWNFQGQPIHPFRAEVMVVAQSDQLANEILELHRSQRNEMSGSEAAPAESSEGARVVA